MQEEQPNFKVTDRRLFNADGAREICLLKRSLSLNFVARRKRGSRPSRRITGETGAGPPEPLTKRSEAEEEFTEEDLADARDPASL